MMENGLAEGPNTCQEMDQSGEELRRGSGTAHAGSLGPRCTVRTIHEVISRFDEKKRDLVESIGFGGLLKFPLIKSTNRRFSSWLMGMVDVGKCILQLSDADSISFCKQDVATVFGIPADGKKIKEARYLSRHDKQIMKVRCWPLSGKEHHSIRAVQELIDTKDPCGMSEDEEDTFKIAFVVFVMSILFVPGAKHDYVCVDYWPALVDPNNIQSFDWADYIVDRLLASATKFQTDKYTGCPNPNVTGCYLFLQVLYLDNIDSGDLTMEHNVLPRIASFHDKRLRGMIAACTQLDADGSTGTDFVKSKHIRGHASSCYSWARQSTRERCDIDRDVQISLWQASVRMARILGLPLEAAGPLFVALGEFERRRPSTSTHYGIECVNVLLNIIQPYVEGYRYHFDLQPTNCGNLCMPCTLDPRDGDDIWQGERTGSSGGSTYICVCNKWKFEQMCRPTERCGSAEELTKTNSSGSSGKYEHTKQPSCGHSSGLKYAVIEAMSQFYLLVRHMKVHNRIDLNAAAVDFESAQCSQQDMVISDVGFARSPWEVGGMWDYQSDTTRHLRLKTSCSGGPVAYTQDGNPRTVDYCPKYIEVMSAAAHDQEMGRSEMTDDHSILSAQMINWHALHSVFDTAMKHVDAQVSDIKVRRVEAGMFEASATVSFHTSTFIGEPSSTKNAARAKLMFNMLR